MRRSLLDIFWVLTRPLLFLASAEKAHRFAFGLLGRMPRFAAAAVRLLGGPSNSPGPVQIGALRLSGPVGLAAGLDKDGRKEPLQHGTYRVHVKQQSSDQWYEIQDLHVSETMPQLIGLSESLLTIYQRRDA